MGAAIKLVSPINEEVLQSEQKDYLLHAIVQPTEADTHVSLDELKCQNSFGLSQPQKSFHSRPSCIHFTTYS